MPAPLPGSSQFLWRLDSSNSHYEIDSRQYPSATKPSQTLGMRLLRWLPRSCVLCGDRCHDRNLCPGCQSDLTVDFTACQRCALPMREFGTCAACLINPPVWDRAFAAYRYQRPLDLMIHRFKFGGDLCCGKELGLSFGKQLFARQPRLPDALIAVPLHWLRLQRRGFNQALLLAQSLSKQLGVPLHDRAIRRCRRTPVQRGQLAAARRKNLLGAFAPTGLPVPRRVAVVDDVWTTGATLTACTLVLRSMGVEQIDVWVCGRVLPPSAT